ncbi:MAG: DNA polymerase III subunit gamma/tau [Microgenomates group bacterium]
MSVFQLKYRPLKITDLDSQSVVRSLTNLLKSKEMPQALLFSGPKGAGKTSAARIVARVLNCTKLKGIEPCGACPSCQEIINGSSLDVIEIDAASNRGIEEARSLKDRAYLSPARLKRKVFIIDEVHMMTRDAFNALLKLLEEPPQQTVFILCTTDEEKLPETVLSRLVRIRFEKGVDEEMMASLTRVVVGEGIKVKLEVLQKIVQNSDRSFRNLHKLFNEIFMETGVEMKEELVSNFFEKRLGEYSESEFENDVIQNKLKEIMEKLEKMAKVGVDFKSFRERLIVYFQQRLLGTLGIGEQTGGELKLNRLEKLLQLLISAGKMETESFIPQLPLELVIVEFIGEEGQTPAAIEKKPSEEIKVSKNNVKVGFGVDKVAEDWVKVLGAVKPFNHSVEAFLRAVRPVKLVGNNLVCEVFYPFHKDKLEEQKNREIVEHGLREVFNVGLVFECVLAKSKQEPIVVHNDTPVETVTPVNNSSGDEMYDVAKQIFG